MSEIQFGVQKEIVTKEYLEMVKSLLEWEYVTLDLEISAEFRSLLTSMSSDFSTIESMYESEVAIYRSENNKIPPFADILQEARERFELGHEGYQRSVFLRALQEHKSITLITSTWFGKGDELIAYSALDTCLRALAKEANLVYAPRFFSDQSAIKFDELFCKYQYLHPEAVQSKEYDLVHADSIAMFARFFDLQIPESERQAAPHIVAHETGPSGGGLFAAYDQDHVDRMADELAQRNSTGYIVICQTGSTQEKHLGVEDIEKIIEAIRETGCELPIFIFSDQEIVKQTKKQDFHQWSGHFDPSIKKRVLSMDKVEWIEMAGIENSAALAQASTLFITTDSLMSWVAGSQLENSANLVCLYTVAGRYFVVPGCTGVLSPATAQLKSDIDRYAYTDYWVKHDASYSGSIATTDVTLLTEKVVSRLKSARQNSPRRR